MDDTWKLNEDNDWKYCIKKGIKLPKQGWKIHITSTIEEAQKCLDKVVPYLVKENISFKFVPNIEGLLLKNSKYGDRASSGKFITIYPESEMIFLKLLPQLRVLLNGFKYGPYILNDKQWYDSNIFFRYGAFVKMTTVVNGRKVYAIQTPDGEYIPDIRAPFYELPDFVDEPKIIKEMTASQNAKYDKEDTSDFDKYDIKSALHFSNAGGVYKAEYNNNFYVIKEGRLHAGLDRLNRDGFSRLNNEYKVLKRLRDKEYVVREKEYFEIWENNYLVEEFINGISLSDFIAQSFPFSIYQDKEKYVSLAKSILNQLKDALIDLHKEGYAVGDLQPSNIMLSDQKIKLIDLETATKIQKNYDPGLQTPGFVAQNVRSFEEADWFAFWRIVRFVFLPIGPVSDLAEDIEKTQDLSISEYFGNDVSYFIKDIKQFVGTQINFKDIGENTGLKAIRISEVTKIDDLVSGLTKGIRKNMNYAEAQLIHGDIKQYTEKFGSYSIAYGGFGAIMALNRLEKLTDSDIKWCRKSGRKILKLLSSDIPVGLFNGISGIACILYEVGESQLAIKLLKRVSSVQKDKHDITIYSGLAGIGLCYLSFYKVVKDKYYLNQAKKALEEIKDNFIDNEATHCKDSSEIPYGFMHGWTGAAYFILKMSEYLNDLSYKKLAEDMLRKELKNNVSIDEKKKTIQVVDYTLGKERLIPYLGEGSIGLALVLSEFRKSSDVFNTNEYNEMFIRLCNVEKTFCCYSPGLLRGAMGFVLLQLLTKQNSKYNLSILQNYLLQDSKKECLLCPGDYNYRVSLDVFTGNAGLILGLLGLKKSSWKLWIPTIQLCKEGR